MDLETPSVLIPWNTGSKYLARSANKVIIISCNAVTWHADRWHWVSGVERHASSLSTRSIFFLAMCGNPGCGHSRCYTQRERHSAVSDSVYQNKLIFLNQYLNFCWLISYFITTIGLLSNWVNTVPDSFPSVLHLLQYTDKKFHHWCYGPKWALAFSSNRRHPLLS